MLKFPIVSYGRTYMRGFIGDMSRGGQSDGIISYKDEMVRLAGEEWWDQHGSDTKLRGNGEGENKIRLTLMNGE